MREYHVRSGGWKAGLVRRSSRKRFAAEERTKRKCEVTAAGSAKDSGRKDPIPRFVNLSDICIGKEKRNPRWTNIFGM